MNQAKEPKISRDSRWRAALTEMRARGVEHGAVFSANWLTDSLGLEFDSMAYRSALINIRKELEAEGKYLSERGQFGAGYVIIPAHENRKEMRRKRNTAFSMMESAVILGESTDMSLLTAEQKRLHESELEKAQTRLALMRRKS